MRTTTRTKLGLHTAGIAAIVASAAAIQPAPAQEGDLTVEVGECVELERPEERLACFEARVAAARGRGVSESPARAPERPASEPPARPPEPPARVNAPAAASGREAAPSSTIGSETRSRNRREERAAEPEIVARVVELRETVPNAHLITLDNGQVWRQTQPGPYPLRPGSEVRIYPAKWLDAYRLTNPELRGFIQVERVR